MNDVYLYRGLSSFDPFEKLIIEFPQIQGAVSEDWLKRTPAYLGLNLSSDVAHQLLAQLEKLGASGVIVPSHYRDPKVSPQAAFEIAEQLVAQIQTSKFPDVHFEPLRLISEGPMWWKFAAESPELIEQDYVPGAIILCIDKQDGHRWETKDFEAAFGKH